MVFLADWTASTVYFVVTFQALWQGFFLGAIWRYFRAFSH
jgi:hypothetical protein